MRTAILFFVFLASFAALAHPPVSVAVDSRGNAYYSDLNAVWQQSPNGTKRIVVPNVHTHELYIDAQDNLFGEHSWYEGDRTGKWGHYVWKRDAAGRVALIKPRTEGFLTNYGFVRDRAGRMYFPSTDRKSVLRDGKTIARGFHEIRWMTAAPDGTVYVVDAGTVVRIAPDGRMTTLARGLGAKRHALMGIWLDGRGNVYLADAANREVKRIAPNGTVSIAAKSTLPWSPSGGAITGNGELLVLEYSLSNAVRLRRVRMK